MLVDHIYIKNVKNISSSIFKLKFKETPSLEKKMKLIYQITMEFKQN